MKNLPLDYKRPSLCSIMNTRNSFYLRNPARHRGVVAIVFFSELFVQCRFFIEDDEEVRGQQHAGHVDCDVRGVIEPGLPSNDEGDPYIHWIANEAMQTFDYQSFGRRDRCWGSGTGQSESPECGVEVDRDADDNEGKSGPFFCTGYGRCILP